jgi:hypothetical protein
MRKTLFIPVVLVFAAFANAVSWQVVDTSGTGEKCPEQLKDSEFRFGSAGTFVEDYAFFTFGDSSLASITICSYGGTGEAIIESEPFIFDSSSPIKFEASIPVVSGLQVFVGADGKFWKQINAPTWWASPGEECFKDLKVKQSASDPNSNEPVYSSYSYSSGQWADGEPHKLSVRVVKGSEKDCFNQVFIKGVSVGGGSTVAPSPPATGEGDGLAWLDDYFLEDETTAVPNKQKLEREFLKLGRALDKKYYVLNPLIDDDSTGLINGLFALFQLANDYSFNALITGKKGLTCGDYVALTKPEVKRIVNDVYGEELIVEEVLLQEASNDPYLPEGKAAFSPFDRVIDTNHICFRITYPGGEQEYLDYWSYQLGEPLMGPWKEKEDHWRSVVEGGPTQDKLDVLPEKIWGKK